MNLCRDRLHQPGLLVRWVVGLCVVCLFVCLLVGWLLVYGSFVDGLLACVSLFVVDWLVCVLLVDWLDCWLVGWLSCCWLIELWAVGLSIIPLIAFNMLSVDVSCVPHRPWGASCGY